MSTTSSAHHGIPHFFLNALRIAAGLLFMQHGAQKLFAVLGREEAVDLVSQMGLAGVLEFYGGLLIVLGLLTRPVAVILAVEMVWAYVQAHMPRGSWPILNGGELPLLYAFIFAFIGANGGGAFSIDGWWASRRRRQAAGG
jgi:putative oxidoreductase